MKTDWSHLSRWRIKNGPMASTDAIGRFGAFQIRVGKIGFSIIASSGDGDGPDSGYSDWEHVSAKTVQLDSKGEAIGQRIPTWTEMCMIKDFFWDKEEDVMQYHPPESSYINIHPHVLHLWKPKHTTIPIPPINHV